METHRRTGGVSGEGSLVLLRWSLPFVSGTSGGLSLRGLSPSGVPRTLGRTSRVRETSQPEQRSSGGTTSLLRMAPGTEGGGASAWVKPGDSWRAPTLPRPGNPHQATPLNTEERVKTSSSLPHSFGETPVPTPSVNLHSPPVVLYFLFFQDLLRLFPSSNPRHGSSHGPVRRDGLRGDPGVSRRLWGSVSVLTHPSLVKISSRVGQRTEAGGGGRGTHLYLGQQV